MANTPLVVTQYERYVEYAANLQRVDAHIRTDVMLLLQRVELNLIEKLNEIDPGAALRSDNKLNRLNQLLKEVREMIRDEYANLSMVVLDDLKDLASVEQAFAVRTINSAVGVELMSTALTPKMLSVLASNTLIMGAPSKEWWGRQSQALQDRFADQMRLGMAQGETLTELSQRVRGAPTGKRTAYRTAAGDLRYTTEFRGGMMDMQRREADALIRSSVQAVSQNARLETYKENDDVVKGVQALVTLDSRTSEICLARSGQSWLLDGTPLAGSGPYPGPPPWHFQCRSTFVAILKSWEDLAPAHKKKQARAADKRGLDVKSMQASMDGPVDAKLSYEDWLKTKPKAFQLELLGPGKHKLWTDGKITFRDLIDQSGNPLSLNELQKRFG